MNIFDKIDKVLADWHENEYGQDFLNDYLNQEQVARLAVRIKKIVEDARLAEGGLRHENEISRDCDNL